ncbi:uncharacterized protein ACNLHF_028207 [Anomaloglossus baeobatrachus]
MVFLNKYFIAIRITIIIFRSGSLVTDLEIEFANQTVTPTSRKLVDTVYQGVTNDSKDSIDGLQFDPPSIQSRGETIPTQAPSSEPPTSVSTTTRLTTTTTQPPTTTEPPTTTQPPTSTEPPTTTQPPTIKITIYD